ncbi:MAG: AzlC family protein [actinobacterium acAMD-5]|jgi:4-azaleucine resistance transporter AzlC|nr:MAG: AzlC family protein [actinobacterium acAMD-5]
MSLTPVLRRQISLEAISIGLATGAYGISFGAIAASSGFSILQTQVLSLLLFTGASQFAYVGVLGAGGSVLSGLATASLLGVRNGLYGMRIAQLTKPAGWQKLFFAQITIDESTALANKYDQSQDTARWAFLAAGLSVYVFWNIATLTGALLATSVGDPKTFGLDAAIGAGFFALVAPRLNSRLNKLLALAAVLVALALTPLLTAGLPVLATALLAIVLAKRAD